MSDDRSFERALSDWLNAGSDQPSERVADSVLLAIRTTRQEREFGLPWRIVWPSQRLVAAAVVAAIALSVIYLNLPSRHDIGGPTPTPTLSPSPTSTPRPTATPRIAGAEVPLDEHALADGVRYVLPDFEPAFTFTASANIRFAIDSTTFAWLFHSASNLSGLSVVRPAAVFAEGGAPEAVPADIVLWLKSRGDLSVSSESSITLGSATGTLLEGTVRADAFHNAGNAINVFCPKTSGCDFESGGSSGFAPGDHVLMLITEVDGQPVTAIASGPEPAWAAMSADSDAFLRSFVFP